MRAEPQTAHTLADAFREARVVGVMRATSAEICVQAGLAAVRGGLRAIEVTFTVPDAPTALAELRRTLPDDVLLGAGTVMSREQARDALHSGATFLVSPHLGEDVLEFARAAAGIDYVPGALTPTEVARAHRLGATVLKIFPIGSSGGPAYLRDLLGPFPNLSAIVTGGVVPEDVPAYIEAGAVAVGLGSNLFPKAALANGDWDAVEEAARSSLAAAGGVD